MKLVGTNDCFLVEWMEELARHLVFDLEIWNCEKNEPMVGTCILWKT